VLAFLAIRIFSSSVFPSIKDMYTGIAAKGFTTENKEEKLAANKPKAVINKVEKGIMSVKKFSIMSQRYTPFMEFKWDVFT
jgi:hypothetical protein